MARFANLFDCEYMGRSELLGFNCLLTFFAYLHGYIIKYISYIIEYRVYSLSVSNI